MVLTPLQKLPNNVGNLGKIIVATCFEWLPFITDFKLLLDPQNVAKSFTVTALNNYLNRMIPSSWFIN